MTAYVPGWRYSRATGWLPDAEQTVPVGSTWKSTHRNGGPPSTVVTHSYYQRGHSRVTLQRVTGSQWTCSPVWLAENWQRVA